MRFQKVQWQYFGYIVYKFGEHPSNNLGIFGVNRAILPRFARNLTTIFIRHAVVPK